KGEYIVDVAKEAVEKFGESHFTDENNIEEIAVWAKEKMLDLIKASMKNNGIEFDNFVHEKPLYDNWSAVEEKLKANNALYTDEEGKVWLKSSEKKDSKDRVVVRENGIPTYLAGDIIYHQNKYERNYDRYINIWGADHHGYIDRVKASIDFLGNDSEKLEILLSQMVALLKGGTPYKMSKRAGNFILMDDVVEDIGIDALRFVFLTKKSDTHLEFDTEQLNKKDSSNPVYYVNYAHARVKSIFRNLKIDEASVVDTPLVDLTAEEKELLFFAMLLPEILEDAFTTRNINIVTDYLYKLATNVHRFYTENKVAGSDREKELLKILSFATLSIRTGLSVIGITAQDKM
ncbi:MAG: arginine--tRNA ligase, partial [Campylobacterales bacterium]|nr:arginine--tRNA ligase [Campylobacterales bacterium]